MASQQREQSAAGFLIGGGEMGALMRAHDWSQSPLGPPPSWPQSLKTAVRIMLTSRQPIWIGWGPQLIYFYNDAYKSIIGGRHPWALGRPTEQVWPEIWDAIGPMLRTALGGEEGTFVEEQLLIMERNGYPEETYYTFSYSPIPDDNGTPGGIICANSEDTQRVIGERQLALLRELAARTTDSRSWRDACQLAAVALATNRHDLPFAALYAAEGGGQQLSLIATCGIAAGTAATPPTIASDDDTLWPVSSALRLHEIQCVDLDEAFTRSLPTGAWETPPLRAAVLPLLPAGETAHNGVLVVGLNPFRLFDAGYRDFLGLVAGQVSAAIATADVYEQARRRAEALAELDRAKTTFFSNISHEFRTPLTLMLGPLEESLAQAAELPPVERERVEIAHRNGMRLLKLVNSLLDFSRIEAGRTRASFEATDLAAFSADIASNFRSITQRAGLTLRVDCTPLPQPVYVDREMWEKVVLNLLSNAFKFTFEGSIDVELHAHDDSARFVVRDTGTGIPHTELPHLFERFRRVEGARGRSFEGSGIGLALVKELVELHGGTIAVESVLQRGSAFSILLPFGTAHLPRDQVRSRGDAAHDPRKSQAFVQEAARWLPLEASPISADAATENAANEDSSPTDDASAAPRARILLADDNADMRDYIRRLLGARHVVETAVDGLAALERARSAPPDLILTDIMMPRLDGLGLIREIRADPNLRDLPVIALSARAGEEASSQGIAAGADDYLIKPFAARELIARVEGALSMAGLRRRMRLALEEEARTLEIINRACATVAAELDLTRAVQTVTDAATQLTGAAFGAFFYNVLDTNGESYMLYTLSGVPREAFAKFPMPRNTGVFGPTFRGEGIVRSDDIRQDPRYGKNAPHNGMPQGHLPVASYLAAPVVSRSGEVVGGLFFGHPQVGVFNQRAEQILVGIAAQAAIAIDNGRLYQAAQREIEERRRTEAALRESEERHARLNQSLESMVVARTAALAQANENLRREAEEREKVEHALRQSQKMEAIGKLTGGVAHDFNNLLQVVGGNLQMLTRDVAGSERAEQRLRNALAGVARGSKLAAQLLAFGRRQPLAPKAVNLGRFIRSLDDLLLRALGEGIEIETVVSAGLWNTLVDTSQVENALLNLAINARDAMSGHGKLTIEAGNAHLTDDYALRHAEVQPGQYVMLAVTDTGCGMPPEVIEQAFEPFFTTKPEGQGTGLGLSMVYGFVKQSGGHIAIYSEPNHGTTVRMYLPRALREEDPAAEPESQPVAGGTETVLVVEDDDDVRNTVVEMLLELGYRVLKARDAQSALAIVESGEPIDLLFTDVVMPGPIRSPELARRAREKLPDVAVLFTSGYTDNAIVHGGMLDPGIELLSKPYTREAMARKLRQVLRGQMRRNFAREKAQSRSGTQEMRPKILLVEDDMLNRNAATEMLSELGFAIDAVADAQAALEALERLDPDVLMTDLNLPGMSGGDLALEARRRKPGLSVIFASGQHAAPPVDGAVVLHKPYSLDGLLEAVRSAAERVRA